MICWLGWHRWTVDVGAHSYRQLQEGDVTYDCARCGTTRKARPDAD